MSEDKKYSNINPLPDPSFPADYWGNILKVSDPSSKTTKASDTQVGGSHYKNMVIQPTEYCHRNELNWCESNIVKYASRHQSKNGAEDIKKIIHYAKFILEFDYGITDYQGE